MQKENILVGFSKGQPIAMNTRRLRRPLGDQTTRQPFPSQPSEMSGDTKPTNSDGLQPNSEVTSSVDVLSGPASGRNVVYRSDGPWQVLLVTRWISSDEGHPRMVKDLAEHKLTSKVWRPRT